tara:strand:- start:55 stop:543 length:489 start_codon:yes stop_codon:yes gene_type:complete
MKYFIYLLLLVFVSSCSLEKRLAKYCPLCVQKDSTETIIQVRDTTITIPGETVYLEDTLYCDSLGNVLSKLNGVLRDKDGKILSLQTKLQNNVYTSKAKVETITKVIKGNDVYHTRVVTKTLKPERIKYIPSWVIFLAYIGGIVLFILLIYTLFKLISSKLP